MKTAKLLFKGLPRLARLALVLVFFQPAMSPAALEQTFASLQIGTTTYRNVTVTTKTKNYFFIIHAQGMTNIKVADLSPDLRVQLGYDDPSASKPQPSAPAAWAKQTLSKLDSTQLKGFSSQVAGWWKSWSPQSVQMSAFSPKLLLLFGSALVALFLLHSYLCLLICTKCGLNPRPLIWIPIIQLFPLLKAASMPAWWFLIFLVPGLNLIAFVVWCAKIAQARGKGFGVALLLIFPLTSLFATLYLAFSTGARARKDDRRVEIMTLEAA